MDIIINQNFKTPEHCLNTTEPNKEKRQQSLERKNNRFEKPTANSQNKSKMLQITE